MNDKLRTEVKTDFEKEFFKLVNNDVFGKAMENVIEHTNIKTCNKRKKKKLFGFRTKFNKVFH